MNVNPAKTLYIKFQEELKNRQPVETTKNNGFFKQPVREKDDDTMQYLYDMFAMLREGREEIKNARSNL